MYILLRHKSLKYQAESNTMIILWTEIACYKTDTHPQWELQPGPICPQLEKHEGISFMPSVNCGTQNQESSVKARRHAIGLSVVRRYRMTVPLTCQCSLKNKCHKGKRYGCDISTAIVRGLTFSSYNCGKEFRIPKWTVQSTKTLIPEL